MRCPATITRQNPHCHNYHYYCQLVPSPLSSLLPQLQGNIPIIIIIVNLPIIIIILPQLQGKKSQLQPQDMSCLHYPHFLHHYRQLPHYHIN